MVINHLQVMGPDPPRTGELSNSATGFREPGSVVFSGVKERRKLVANISFGPLPKNTEKTIRFFDMAKRCFCC